MPDYRRKGEKFVLTKDKLKLAKEILREGGTIGEVCGELDISWEMFTTHVRPALEKASTKPRGSKRASRVKLLPDPPSRLLSTTQMAVKIGCSEVWVSNRAKVLDGKRYGRYGGWYFPRASIKKAKQLYVPPPVHSGEPMGTVESWVPKWLEQKIRREAETVDSSMSAFLRGKLEEIFEREPTTDA